MKGCKSSPCNLSITGVSQAIEHINSTIAPALVSEVRQQLCPQYVIDTFKSNVSCFLSPQEVSVVEQERIDQMMIDMDGTENKCKKPSLCDLIFHKICKQTYLHINCSVLFLN